MFRVGDIEVALTQADLQAMLSSPSGPVAREMARIGARGEAIGKELATGVLVSVDTGRYRSSIGWRLFRINGMTGVLLSAGVHYAVYLEDGTQHISPRRVIQTAAEQAVAEGP